MVRVGDRYTAINGNQCVVKRIKNPPYVALLPRTYSTEVFVLVPMFNVESTNPLGRVQFLWYTMDGQCWGPWDEPVTRWDGDDIVFGIDAGPDQYFVWWR